MFTPLSLDTMKQYTCIWYELTRYQSWYSTDVGRLYREKKIQFNDHPSFQPESLPTCLLCCSAALGLVIVTPSQTPDIHGLPPDWLTKKKKIPLVKEKVAAAAWFLGNGSRGYLLVHIM
jgi:hypothetical protein